MVGRVVGCGGYFIVVSSCNISTSTDVVFSKDRSVSDTRLLTMSDVILRPTPTGVSISDSSLRVM